MRESENERKIRHAIAALGPGATYKAIASHAGVSTSTAHRIAQSLEILRKRKSTDSICVIEGLTADDTLPDAATIYSRLEAIQDEAEMELEKRYSQTIKIPGGKPVGIVFSSDWHFGGRYVDYRSIQRDIQTIVETEGMYTVLGGDYHENWIGRIFSPQYQNELTIEQELTLVDDAIGKLHDKILAMCAGNHDAGRHVKVAGWDHIRRLLKGSKFLYDRDEVCFTLKLGSTEWRVKLRHKWRGYSQYNPTHGQEKDRKFVELHDISIGGHTHNGTLFREEFAHGKYRMNIQTGTYKYHDDYGVEQGFSQTPPNPVGCLILYPDGSWMTAKDLQRAAGILGYLRM